MFDVPYENSRHWHETRSAIVDLCCSSWNIYLSRLKSHCKSVSKPIVASAKKHSLYIGLHDTSGTLQLFSLSIIQAKGCDTQGDRDVIIGILENCLAPYDIHWQMLLILESWPTLWCCLSNWKQQVRSRKNKSSVRKQRARKKVYQAWGGTRPDVSYQKFQSYGLAIAIVACSFLNHLECQIWSEKAHLQCKILSTSRFTKHIQQYDGCLAHLPFSYMEPNKIEIVKVRLQPTKDSSGPSCVKQ